MKQLVMYVIPAECILYFFFCIFNNKHWYWHCFNFFIGTQKKKSLLILSLANDTKFFTIKNRTYCFFNDMINLKDFDSKLLTTDTKSHKIIGIYYVGYITIKFISDYESITSVNPLYFTISEVN